MTARGTAAAALALALAACPAPRPTVRPPPLPLAPGDQHDEPALAGVVHVVALGETIYRIARAYQIDPADLMETNGISDPRSLAVGTELFVPGAARVVEVPPAPVPGDPAGASTPAATATATATTSAAATATTAAPSPRPPSAMGEGRGGEGGSAAKPSPRVASLSPPPTARAGSSDPVLAWPLKGVLYGRYGVRAGRRHDGIDIAAPEGTAVGAAAAGTVLYAGEQSGYGSIVILKHEGGLVTLYAHASRVLVREGARVKRGQPIATVGQTGQTTGPHLHFEVRDGTRPRNPLLYLP